MGMGPLVGEMEGCVQSMVGAFIAGACAWGVTGVPRVHGQVSTSLFGGVVVGLGSQSGWEGVVGQPASGHMGLGFAT